MDSPSSPPAPRHRNDDGRQDRAQSHITRPPSRAQDGEGSTTDRLAKRRASLSPPDSERSPINTTASTRIPALHRRAGSLKTAFEASSAASSASTPVRPLHSAATWSSRSHLPVKSRRGHPHAQTRAHMDAVGHGRQLSAGQWDRPGRGRGSSSSPPRGLREAYARIVDEENLAAAESPPLPDEATEDHEEDDAVSIDRTGRHLLVPHDHRHEHHLQAERARALASPRALPFPVRPSGHVERHRHQGTLPEADHPQELDDGTVGSSSLSGSTVSGLSSLENGTDDSFVRTLATHRRDQRRVKGALTNGQPVFSRALHGDANGLTSEDLRPRDRLDRILVAENEVAEEAASLASNHSDSAIHLPNGWGRRNRRRREWLRQTATHSDGDDGGRRLHIPREDKPPDPAREPSHQDDDASAIDWLAAGADTPLPSVEADSSTDGTALSSDSNPSRSTRPPAASSADRPPPPHPEPDLTARSLVTSRSPIIRAKLTVLERIREREMEALKGQALTRNRLDQIRERSTPEPLRSRQRSGQADDDDEQGRDDDRDGPRSSGPASPRSEHAPFKSAREEGANDGSSSSVVPASDQAQPDPPPAHPAPRPANEAPDLQHPPNKGQPARARADRTKTDSRDLLRQLARAASNSPSPKLDAARPAPAEAESDGPSARQPPDHSNAVVSDPRPPGVDDDDDDSGLDDGLEDLTPRAEKGPMGVATPAIAVGGWVDTPAGRGQAIHHPLSSPSSSSSSSSPSTDLAVRRGLSKFKVRDLLDRRGPGSLAHERKKGQAPPQDDHERARPDKTSHVLPPSTDVTNMPSRDDMEIDLTMDSLDRLIADETLDFTASNLIPDPDPAALVDLRRSKDQPANEIDGDGQLDKVTYDRMNRRLRTLLLSIRDAKHGIDVLEDRVGRTDDDSVRACPECGRHLAALCSRHDRPWYHRFRIPFLTVYRRTNDGKHLLTWFGLIWLTVWGYLLAELLTCVFFCRKGSWEDDPFGYVAPRLPFAIFGTFRWYLPWIANPFGAYMCRNFAVVNHLFPDRCDWLTWPIDWPIYHTDTTTTITKAATEAVFTSTTIANEEVF